MGSEMCIRDSFSSKDYDFIDENDILVPIFEHGAQGSSKKVDSPSAGIVQQTHIVPSSLSLQCFQVHPGMVAPVLPPLCQAPSAAFPLSRVPAVHDSFQVRTRPLSRYISDLALTDALTSAPSISIAFQAGRN